MQTWETNQGIDNKKEFGLSAQQHQPGEKGMDVVKTGKMKFKCKKEADTQFLVM